MTTEYRLVPGEGLGSLRKTEAKDVPLGARDVRVAVRAVSLNQRDLMVAHGQLPVGHPRPTVPASDAAGEVLEVGTAVSRFKPGDRVVTTFYPLQPWPRLDARVVASPPGAVVDGVLAERVALDEGGLVHAPRNLDHAEAATIPVAGVTAWAAVFEHAQARPGDTVLLLGTGGVSIWGLQIARAAGLRTIITSSSDAKLDRARALGADAVIHYGRQADWEREVLRLTGGAGVDVVLEVGGVATLDRSVAATRMGGTIALIGLLAGPPSRFDPYQLLFGAKRLAGVRVGSRADQEALHRHLEQSGIHPVVDRRFPYAEAPAAFEHLASAKHFGKVVIEV